MPFAQMSAPPEISSEWNAVPKSQVPEWNIAGGEAKRPSRFAIIRTVLVETSSGGAQEDSVGNLWRSFEHCLGFCNVLRFAIDTITTRCSNPNSAAWQEDEIIYSVSCHAYAITRA